MDLLKTDYSANVSEIGSKIPIISGLATNSALTAVENKIPDKSLDMVLDLIDVKRFHFLLVDLAAT